MQSFYSGFLGGRLKILFSIGIETVEARFRGGRWSGGRLIGEICNGEGW